MKCTKKPIFSLILVIPFLKKESFELLIQQVGKLDQGLCLFLQKTALSIDLE